MTVSEAFLWYNVGVLAFLGCLCGILLVNLAVLPRIRRTDRPRNRPSISVLVPARNEEENIGPCLESLLAQDYPDYSVTVLDDNSEDRTREIVRRIADREPRLTLIPGAPLPDGWMGKSFACHQLAANAKGEYFLFTDADTRHAPECLSAALAAMERTRADLLTVMPEEEMGSRGEKLVIPLLHFILFAFLPLPLVHASRKKLFAMGNGQFLLFRRAAYEAIGGHTAVRDALVEDIGLGRRIKERGFRLRIADGSAIVRCRMYRDFRGVWEGFSKNLYAGFDYSFPAIAGVMAVQIAAFILPLPLLVAGFLSRSASAWPWALPALQLALALLMRIVLSFRFRLDRGYALLHVVSEILLVALSVNSVRWILSGGGARWKGRRYDFRRSAGRLDPSTRNDDWRS